MPPSSSPPPRRLGPRVRALRDAVIALRREHRGRSFPARVCVGDLGQRRADFAVPTDRDADRALVADMVEALVDRALADGVLPLRRAGDGWVLRYGSPVDTARDRQWLWEISRTLEARGLRTPDLWVITKSGGTDVRSGRTHTWVRARAHD